MLELDLPIVIPSYICTSKHFNGFINDLHSIGVNKVIVIHDFNISVQSLSAHRNEIKNLRRTLGPIFKQASVKFTVLPNVLLEPIVYSIADLSSFICDQSEYCFVTIPLSTDPQIAIKNIFSIKNLGIHPIISSFEDITAFFPKAFCQALLTTEKISFIFDTSSLYSSKVKSYISTATNAENNIFFSVSHFTSSVINRELKLITDELSKAQKMTLGYLSYSTYNRLY